MEMRWWLWTSLLVFGLTVGRVFAQDAARPVAPALDVRVVRVRVVHTVGMCGGYGHCNAITTISPSFISRESKDSGDKQKFPNRRTKRAITRQDWESLLRAIDKESLKAIPQTTGCRSCIDLPDTWLEVNLSDGTHISVSFDPESPPPPVATLLREIETIDAKSKPR